MHRSICFLFLTALSASTFADPAAVIREAQELHALSSKKAHKINVDEPHPTAPARDTETPDAADQGQNAIDYCKEHKC